jgi:hypothetical protein
MTRTKLVCSYLVRLTVPPGKTLRRTGGLAGARQLSYDLQRPECIVWTAVRIRLTAPTDSTIGSKGI